MQIYVTGLAYSIDSASLNALFANYGVVIDAKVVSDQQSGRSQGFGFVNMPDADHARKAITYLRGRMVQGRVLGVKEARQ